MVVIGIIRWRVAFVLDGFFYEGLIFLGVHCGHTAERHVGQAIAVHVAVGIVGGIEDGGILSCNRMVKERMDALIVVKSAK